ncbi:MAG: GH25 family lysozyme [Bacteroidota bacterium]
MAKIEGIDVSHYQGSIDWEAVAASGVKFAFVKATEGFTWRDARFRSNWQGAKQAGIAVGAYHFFRTKDGTRQANNILRRLDEVGFEPGDLLPVIDVETWDPAAGSQSTYISYIEDWLTRVEDKLGRKAIIYTFASFWRRIGNPDQFSEYPIWAVDLSRPNNPRIPRGWTDYDVLQYDHHGSVAGISGDVDLNHSDDTKISRLRL